MRNQYKVLAEKYELILNEQEGREINGVFVPAEIEDWIDNVLKMPKFYGRGPYAKILGTLFATDYIAEELKTIIKNIYPKVKDYTAEELEPLKARRPEGYIYKTLADARVNAKKTPEQIQKDKERKTNWKLKKKAEKLNSLLQGNAYNYIRGGTVNGAITRSIKNNIPFFPEILIKYLGNRPLSDYKNLFGHQKSQILDAAAKTILENAWPKDGLCPATGIVLVPNLNLDLSKVKKPMPNSPSLDKFIPNKGYVVGNIQFISSLANVIKNRGTMEQVEAVKNYAAKGYDVLKEIKNYLNGFEGKIDNPITLIHNRKRNKLSQLLHATFRRSKLNSLPVPNLDLSYLESILPLDMKCPVFGTQMNWSPDKATWNSPSLDRIYPEKGYTRGNVVFISNLANLMKNSATPEQVIGVYNWMKAHNAVPDPQIREELIQQEQQNAQSI